MPDRNELNFEEQLDAKLRKYALAAALDAPLWDNTSCLGYALEAMLRCGISAEDVRKTERCMKLLFDTRTVEEAKSWYCNELRI